MKGFKKLYNQKKNDAQISRILNCSRREVRNYRISLNLPSVYNSAQRFDYQNIIYNKKILSALKGTLLGDSWLNISTYTKGTTATGGFAHSVTQEAYFNYKYNLLKNICNTVRTKKLKNIFIGDREIGSKDQFHVNFKSSPFLKEIYNTLYANGKKVITKEFLKDYTALSLALHYCDDGSKISNNKNSLRYVIHTECFDKQSLKIFQDFLLEKWGLKSSIFSNNVLYIKAESAKKFKSIIKPFIIPEMVYKIKSGVYKPC